MRPDRTPERPRRVHRTDWMALLCGLLFIGIGVRYLTGPIPDPVIMAPVLVGGLGFAAFVAILAKAIRR
ncbi:hypothetical protein GCM10009530_53560 [Microbispora corallina]|uniref:XapX domain-containing protein n=1 Tax=Microbispora corallina TaxID=83302 RepID=A0ABQ4G4K0_9ACTN|nr:MULTISPECIES: hypothetical protein [Microbispora]ETK33248.1 hypothetical protein MPTA5024_25575 [Microbispora sp. ATCC PTA-5024]GIH41998.1 hypothetical protein Mco01_49980 [Microbispora corallina]